MKRARSVAMTQAAPERNFHLLAMFLWAALFSISASVSLIAAAIYIH